ncbi:multimerin-2 [Tiliqua scincoides]|uniref:multimerin-2 n=1 Tax=Tiliqua scincoides TaxID=71010 RepID=UPI0034633AEC
MITTILLLCGTIKLVHSETHTRYPGHHDHKQRPEDQRVSTDFQLPSLPEGRELIQEETLNQAFPSLPEMDDDYEAGDQEPRNKNWCSFMRSRMVTRIAACNTEKYIIKSQQPCPNGTPDCQKIMYRAALKPVYKVKQEVRNFLHWKCCPGYTGKNCENHEPNFLPVSTNQPGSWEEEKEAFASQRDILEDHQSHEALLKDLQNDIHQATSNLGDLQKMLHYNISSTRMELNLNRTEIPEQLFQQMLFPHMESFLNVHFNPVLANFSKSLQGFVIILKNLSQNVEANRKSIEKFQESTVPKKDFQELGTKFESKVQENILRVDQMKREADNHLHLQQAAIHYNLTMIKADTDMKLKRYHKIQHSVLLALNNSITDMRQEQEKLRDKLEAVTRNFAAFPLEFGNPREKFTEKDIEFLNQTLENHAQELKDLFEESDEAFKDINNLNNIIKDMRASTKLEIEELRMALMEKSLITEEIEEDLERKIVALNGTLANIEERLWDLQSSMKACHCEKPSSEFDTEEQANITQITRDEIKQFEAHLKDLRNEIKDLATALPHILQSLDFQQEQSRQLEGSVSLLKRHTNTSSKNIDNLEKADEKMLWNIKYLNSSFNSLLDDAMRHETALVTLLGEEIMDSLSEEDPSTLISSIHQFQEVIKEQNITLESLTKKIHYLEMNCENHPNAHKLPKLPVLEKQIEDTVQETSSQHSSVEHMEPNHEAVMEDIMDNPTYHDIMTLKKEIGHLSREMKKYESQWERASFCCNYTVVGLVEPLGISVENLKEGITSTQRSLEEHLQIFQKLFGSIKDLAAANTSLDVTKIQSMLSRKMRKQLKVQEKHNMRDKKEANDHRGGTLNGRHKIPTESLDTDLSVAFYMRHPEGSEGALNHNATYLNYGGGYFPEHGYFKSPHTGVYMVAVSTEFTLGPLSLGELVFSNGHRMTLISNKLAATGSFMTTFALVELKKGEHMWFELVQGAAVKQNPAGMSMAVFLIFKT